MSEKRTIMSSTWDTIYLPTASPTWIHFKDNACLKVVAVSEMRSFGLQIVIIYHLSSLALSILYLQTNMLTYTSLQSRWNSAFIN